MTVRLRVACAWLRPGVGIMGLIIKTHVYYLLLQPRPLVPSSSRKVVEFEVPGHNPPSIYLDKMSSIIGMIQRIWNVSLVTPILHVIVNSFPLRL